MAGMVAEHRQAPILLANDPFGRRRLGELKADPWRVLDCGPHVRDTYSGIPNCQAEVPGPGGAERKHGRCRAGGRTHIAARGRRGLRSGAGLLQAGQGEGAWRDRQGAGEQQRKSPSRDPGGSLRQAVPRRAGRFDGAGRFEHPVRQEGSHRDHGGGPAGERQDHHGGQAGAFAGKARPPAPAGCRGRVPPRRYRPAPHPG